MYSSSQRVHSDQACDRTSRCRKKKDTRRESLSVQKHLIGARERLVLIKDIRLNQPPRLLLKRVLDVFHDEKLSLTL